MGAGRAVMACMCAEEPVGNTQCQWWGEAKWPQHRPPLFMCEREGGDVADRRRLV